MPTYTYQCTKCDKFFDEMFMMREDSSIAKCPDCGKIAPKNFGRSMPNAAEVFEPYYHIGHGEWVTSKQQIKDIDKARGTITPWVYDGCGREIQGQKCEVIPRRDRPIKKFI